MYSGVPFRGSQVAKAKEDPKDAKKEAIERRYQELLATMRGYSKSRLLSMARAYVQHHMGKRATL